MQSIRTIRLSNFLRGGLSLSNQEIPFAAARAYQQSCRVPGSTILSQCNNSHYNFNQKRSYQHHQQQQQYHQESAEESIMPSQPVLLVVGGYLALVNLFAAGLFWYDKRQALTKGWRIPEKQLQMTALLGGWVGGLWAMQTFKHKTIKKEFREPYNLAMMGNWVIMGGIAGAWVFLPQARRSLQSKVKGIMRG
ncbi:hypothetical protein BDR26DRAFT_865277 [Obelidium mucronatum]|nr:hypothetical protein BDR26DRAFT_865277 [Obelidium mucronatum]